MEEMSSHKTLSSKTSGGHGTPQVVRRKRDRPRKIPKEPSADKPVEIRRIPGRPRKNTSTLAAAVEQERTSSFGISIPNSNDIQRLVADTLNVISATQSHTACPSDSVSERDNGSEGLQKKQGVASAPGVQKGRKREGEKNTVKQEACFLEQAQPEERGKLCSRVDKERIQPVTPSDLNKSPPRTIESSRQQSEFQCKGCDLSSKFRSHYRLHVRHHNGTPTNPKTTPTDLNKFPPRTLECSRSLAYICDICNQTLYTQRGFHAHVRAHSDAKHQCVLCGKLFTFPSELNTHRYFCRKKGARRLSSQCSKLVFTGPNSVTSPPAPTPDGGHFSSRPLQSLQTHRKEALVSCTPSHSTLIPQHRSHFVSTFSSLDNRSDPRKYQCPHCGRLFRHMGRLRAHMLTHAQGQSYTCGSCAKTFESWRKLWHHQRVHRQRRGRFSCPQCGQGFRFAEPYRRHMAGHPEYQWIQRRSTQTPLPYQCELCTASFETLDLLFSHQSCHFSSVHGADHHVQPSLDGDPPLEWTLTLPVNPCTPRGGELHGGNADANASLPGASLQGPHQSFGSARFVQPVSPCVSRVAYRTVTEGPVGTPSTLKIQQLPQEAVGAVSPEDIRCVVCGKCWPTISELYLHYLQHARGQL